MKRICRQCHERPAIFMRRDKRGRLYVNSDDDHDLCMQCARSATSALHARGLRVKSENRAKLCPGTRTEVLAQN